MQLWQCADGSGQFFDFEYNTGSRAGSLLRLARNPDYCVVIDGNQGYDGARLQLWTCDPNNAAQRWSWGRASGPYVTYSNEVHHDKCIVVDGNRAYNGNGLQVWSCDAAGEFAEWFGH